MPAQLVTKEREQPLDASVIIPTYNRYESLFETLDSLAAQRLPASEFEVVVVDDGSTDATPSVASRRYPFSLQYVRQENRGAAAARNLGAKASQGRVLVFIDDDITLDPGYLGAIIDVHGNDRRLVSMGVFQPYLEGDDSPFARYHARRLAETPFRRKAQTAARDGGATPLPLGSTASLADCSSNNLAISHAAFQELGGWHDVFGDGPTLWGDVEFGYRAWRAGLCFVWVPDARLYHRDQHVESLQAASRRALHIGRTVHFLYQRHPEIAEHVPTFRDKEPVDLTSDPPSMIVDKLFHIVTATPPVLWAMERLADILESNRPDARGLGRLYRWIVSAYLFKGYRLGRREVAGKAR
jgi:glycosyltransferase involved in cell wall biosynthesis